MDNIIDIAEYQKKTDWEDADPNNVLGDADEVMICNNCQNALFFVSPEGYICRQCGLFVNPPPTMEEV